MISVRLQARDAIVGALNAAARPADVPPATTRRWVPGDETRLPQIGVWFVEEEAMPTRGSRGGTKERVLQVAIQCTAAGDAPEDVEDLVEDLLAWAVTALADTRLGGLVHSMEEAKTTWEAGRLDKYFISAAQVWNLTYQTTRSDLTRSQ